MRIDKFLKVSRIIKRRSVASECCSGGKITINGKVVKSGDRVKVNDIIEISLGENKIRVEVLDISEHVSKDGAKELYKVI